MQSNPFTSLTTTGAGPSYVLGEGGTLTCASFRPEVFGMFVRWLSCYAHYLCSWNGVELWSSTGRLQFANFFFLFLSLVIVLFKLTGVIMMKLRKTEHIWRILIMNHFRVLYIWVLILKLARRYPTKVSAWCLCLAIREFFTLPFE
jgi:hypothetical protein